jgi:histidinol-phosphate/aromatic aminotransferase/cobyric acid decarboxylase-like protein
MESPDPVVHGALDHAELARLGLHAADLLDFSSNINPFGPPESVRAALAALDPAPYPDRSCLQLREALALRHGVAHENVLAGNGSNELIHLLAHALLQARDTALVIAPAFGEYAHACRLTGIQVLEWRLSLEQSLDDEIAAIPELLERLQPRLTWLCAPNNPTGRDPSPPTIRRLAEYCAACGGLLIVDRAYAGMRRAAGSRDELDAEPPLNLLRLHSLTKTYALAGLRLGYLLGSADLLAQVARYQPAWSVNSAAQTAGLAALHDTDFVATTLPRLWAAGDALVAGLRQHNLTIHRAALPFLLLRSGNGAQTRSRLLQHGCVVRDCASFGLPEWVRIAPRREEDNRRLIEAIGKKQ